MQIVIEQRALLKALSRVQGVVERRNTIPILSNVLLIAEKGEGLSLVATDLDMEVRERAAAEVIAPGRITVPAATLFELVWKAPAGAQVQLRFDDQDPRLAVGAGRFNSKLPVRPAGDFPEMPDIDWATSFEVGAGILRRLIEKTRFAISTEETRYYLNGLYLHTYTEVDERLRLRAVATDGHRLALAQVDAPEGSAAMPPVIVPRKTVNELLKLLDGAQGNVVVSASPQKVRFHLAGEVAGAALTSKVIDGAFPDYMRVIPVNNPHVLTLDAALFSTAVDRVAVISTEKTRSVKLSLEPGKLTLQVRNAEAGSSVEELEVDYDGPAIELGLSARYAIDVGAQIDGENMSLAFDGPACPVLVTDPNDASTRFVVMPLRV